MPGSTQPDVEPGRRRGADAGSARCCSRRTWLWPRPASRSTPSLDEGVLDRTGVRAALAYLRLAAEPGMLDPHDLLEVYRRPSRGLPNWITKWLGRCPRSPTSGGLANRLDDAKVAAKLGDLADDLERLTALASSGASTRDLLTAVRDAIGLGSAMTLLDSTGGASGSHLDDLEALLQVADLQPDAERVRGMAATVFPPPPRAGRRGALDGPPGEGPRVAERRGRSA